MYLINKIMAIIGLFFAPAMAVSQTIYHKELLGRPTEQGITIQVVFNDTVELSVQYGTTSGNYTSQTAWRIYNAAEPAEIVLSGLRSNTRYYYRIAYRKPNTTAVTYRPEYKFHTQRSVGEAFTFVIQADPHLDEQSDTNVYLRCLQNQLADNPDFMIDLGDIFMIDKLKNPVTGRISRDTVVARSHLMRSLYETTAHSVPLFMALGNHEGEAGWQLTGTADNIAVWGTLERKKYFLNPVPDAFYTGDSTQHAFVGQRENYYAWTWGDALFIVLDPYWYTKPKPDSLNGWRWTLGKQQYDWLRTTLENSRSKFKFVFAHQLVGGDPDGRGGVEFADKYEWGGTNLNGTYGFNVQRPGWYKPIKELLKENRVNVFFHGHDHFFGKQEKDCLIYQECPQPSHPNFLTASYAQAYGYTQGQILPNSGHLRVTVSSENVRVEYVRTYLARNETATRRNGDVSAAYVIGSRNCYDSTTTALPIIWNANYSDEIVYPNPFQQATTIGFSLHHSEYVDMCILNEQGQIIRHLMSKEWVPMGSFNVVWDGTNDSGHTVPNGLYIYLIKGENRHISSGKIMLEK